MSERARKRQRISSDSGVSNQSSGLFEEEAEVEDEEDEDVDEDEEGLDGELESGLFAEQDEEEEAQSRTDVGIYRRKAFTEDDRHDESISEAIREYEKRSELAAGDDDYGSLADVASRQEIEEQALLPDVRRDPKLWMLKCKDGKERTIVLHLMQKYFNCLGKGDSERLFIKSAIAPAGLRGYVYVEATKEVHVRKAVEGIRDLNSWELRLVPIGEMPACLRAAKQEEVASGAWVRVTRGTYKGDLGQLDGRQDTAGRVVVKLVPRLNLGRYLEAPGAEEVEGADADGKEAAAAKRRRARRPDAKLFDRNEIDALAGRGAVDERGGFYHFSGERFGRDGFVYKQMAFKSLETHGVMPELEELRHFQTALMANSEGASSSSSSSLSRMNDDDGDGDGGSSKFSADGSAAGGRSGARLAANMRKLAALQPKRKVAYQKGDPIRVMRGDLKGLLAIVHRVDGDQLEVLPKDEDINQLIPLAAADVVKHFNLGDHVKVISGRYDGETGLILRIDAEIVVLFSDITRKEIQVLAQDIQRCTELATGHLRLGNYELHDLVQLTPQIVGVIIKVERESFKILDNNGDVRTVSLREVGKKRRSRDATAFDKYQNPIEQGDLVKVLAGACHARQGTVMHLWRHFAFLRSNDVLEHSGIFVVRTSVCQVVGAKSSASAVAPPAAAAPNFGMAPATPGMVPQSPSQRQAVGVPRNPNYGRAQSGYGVDDLRGKQVRIRRGRWKGMLGLVRSCTETRARVEIGAVRKTVDIERSNLTDQIRVAGGAASRAGGAFSSDGWATSAAFAPATPSGLQTPSHAPATPSMRTPSHDWAPDTPARDWAPETPRPTPMAGVGGGDDWLDSAGAGAVQTPSDSWSAMTPSSAAAMASSYSAPTPSSYSPAGVPLTPGGASTPLASTPGSGVYSAGGYGAAPTPGSAGAGAFLSHAPSTPGAAPTPGSASAYGGATPQPLTPGAAPTVGSGADGSWLSPQIVVHVVRGEYANRQGIVVSVEPNASCMVHIEGIGQVHIPSPDYLQPGTVLAHTTVKVILGPHRGQVATVNSVDPTDGSGLVNLASGMVIIPLAHLAPFQ
jgi:transcription elongation factor SPT5